MTTADAPTQDQASAALLDNITSEARIAFVRYVDAKTGNGKGAAAIWCDAYAIGFQRGLAPRTIVEIEAEAAAMLAAEYGV